MFKISQVFRKTLKFIENIKMSDNTNNTCVNTSKCNEYPQHNYDNVQDNQYTTCTLANYDFDESMAIETIDEQSITERSSSPTLYELIESADNLDGMIVEESLSTDDNNSNQLIDETLTSTWDPMEHNNHATNNELINYDLYSDNFNSNNEGKNNWNENVNEISLGNSNFNEIVDGTSSNEINDQVVMNNDNSNWINNPNQLICEELYPNFISSGNDNNHDSNEMVVESFITDLNNLPGNYEIIYPTYDDGNSSSSFGNEQSLNGNLNQLTDRNNWNHELIAEGDGTGDGRFIKSTYSNHFDTSEGDNETTSLGYSNFYITQDNSSEQIEVVLSNSDLNDITTSHSTLNAPDQQPPLPLIIDDGSSSISSQPNKLENTNLTKLNNVEIQMKPESSKRPESLKKYILSVYQSQVELNNEQVVKNDMDKNKDNDASKMTEKDDNKGSEEKSQEPTANDPENGILKRILENKLGTYWPSNMKPKNIPKPAGSDNLTTLSNLSTNKEDTSSNTTSYSNMQVGNTDGAWLRKESGMIEVKSNEAKSIAIQEGQKNTNNKTRTNTNVNPKKKYLKESMLLSMLTEKSRSPMLSEKPRSPMLSEKPRSPMLSEKPRSPMLSEKLRSPMLSEKPTSPMLSENPRSPMLSEKPRSLMLSEKPRSPMLSQKLPDKPRLPMSSQKPRSSMLSQKEIANQFSRPKKKTAMMSIALDREDLDIHYHKKFGFVPMSQQQGPPNQGNESPKKDNNNKVSVVKEKRAKRRASRKCVQTWRQALVDKNEFSSDEDDKIPYTYRRKPNPDEPAEGEEEEEEEEEEGIIEIVNDDKDEVQNRRKETNALVKRFNNAQIILERIDTSRRVQTAIANKNIEKPKNIITIGISKTRKIISRNVPLSVLVSPVSKANANKDKTTTVAESINALQNTKNFKKGILSIERISDKSQSEAMNVKPNGIKEVVKKAPVRVQTSRIVPGQPSASTMLKNSSIHTKMLDTYKKLYASRLEKRKESINGNNNNNKRIKLINIEEDDSGKMIEITSNPNDSILIDECIEISDDDSSDESISTASSAPSRSAPTTSARSRSTPMASVPSRSTPMPSVPSRSILVSSAPSRSTPVSSAPSRSTPISSAPSRSTPISSAPSRSTPVSSVPSKATSRASVSSKTTPISSNSSKSIQILSAPSTSASSISVPTTSATTVSTPTGSAPTESTEPSTSSGIDMNELDNLCVSLCEDLQKAKKRKRKSRAKTKKEILAEKLGSGQKTGQSNAVKNNAAGQNKTPQTTPTKKNSVDGNVKRGASSTPRAARKAALRCAKTWREAFDLEVEAA